jgi:hypothetical protein
LNCDPVPDPAAAPLYHEDTACKPAFDFDASFHTLPPPELIDGMARRVLQFIMDKLVHPYLPEDVDPASLVARRSFRPVAKKTNPRSGVSAWKVSLRFFVENVATTWSAMRGIVKSNRMLIRSLNKQLTAEFEQYGGKVSLDDSIYTNARPLCLPLTVKGQGLQKNKATGKYVPLGSPDVRLLLPAADDSFMEVHPGLLAFLDGTLGNFDLTPWMASPHDEAWPKLRMSKIVVKDTATLTRAECTHAEKHELECARSTLLLDDTAYGDCVDFWRSTLTPLLIHEGFETPELLGVTAVGKTDGSNLLAFRFDTSVVLSMCPTGCGHVHNGQAFRVLCEGDCGLGHIRTITVMNYSVKCQSLTIDISLNIINLCI